MKIQINVSDENFQEVKERLLAAGFEIDDDGEFIISEKSISKPYIMVKNNDGEKVKLLTDDIIFLESFGHSVVIHACDGNNYQSSERLYKFSDDLDSTKFLRVSNCAIISKAHVKKIKPTFSMKYILTMSDGSLVDVTRSYYPIFKEIFGI